MMKIIKLKIDIKEILKENNILNLMNEFIKELNNNSYFNELYNDNGEYDFIKWLKDNKNILINIDVKKDNYNIYNLDYNLLNKIAYYLSFEIN